MDAYENWLIEQQKEAEEKMDKLYDNPGLDGMYDYYEGLADAYGVAHSHYIKHKKGEL